MQTPKKSCGCLLFRAGQRKICCVFMLVLKLYSPVDLSVHTANNFSKFGVEAELFIF